MNNLKKIAIVLATWVCSQNALSSGIPVGDGANLSQNLMGYVESLSQGVQLVTSYTLQLKQYENELLRYEEMLDARKLPGYYIFDQIYQDSLRLRQSFEFGTALVNRYSDPKAYAYDLINRHIPLNCLRTWSCAPSDSARAYQELNTLQEERNEFLRNRIEQNMRNSQTIADQANKKNSALMSQIKNARSERQAQHAIAEATVAVADSIATQTLAMQQIEHNRLSQEAQERAQSQASVEFAKSLIQYKGGGPVASFTKFDAPSLPPSLF